MAHVKAENARKNKCKLINPQNPIMILKTDVILYNLFGYTDVLLVSCCCIVFTCSKTYDNFSLSISNRTNFCFVPEKITCISTAF